MDIEQRRDLIGERLESRHHVVVARDQAVAASV